MESGQDKQGILDVDTELVVKADSSLSEFFESVEATDLTGTHLVKAAPEPTVSMAEGLRSYQIHRFNGQNYQLWRRQMEIYMAENKLKKYILGIEVKNATNAPVWEEKDAEAQAFLMRGIELEQLKYVTDCETAAQIWSRLQAVHAEKSDMSAQVLLEKFITCKMSEEESIVDFVATITSLTQRLKDINIEQKEPMVIAKILSSLPSKYDHVRSSWYAVPKDSQKVETLTELLVNEESLINMRMVGTQKADISKTAYIAKTNNSWSGGSSKNYANAKRRGKCNYCHIQGHWARECHKKLKDVKTKNQEHGHSLALRTGVNAKTSKTADNENIHLFILHKLSLPRKNFNIFYADSGATDHMTFQRELFHNYTELPNGLNHVRVGDGRKLNVVGRGNIKVQISDGTEAEYTISDVLLVPELDGNFISISKAAKSMDIHFEEATGRVLFLKQNKILVEGYEAGGLYKLNVKPKTTKEACLNTVCIEPIKLWHDRLGHVNFKTLQEMSNGNVVSGLHMENIPKIIPFCRGCTYGKLHRESFPKTGAHRAKQPGEIFHIDLCGKMSTSSIGGANYFMLVKDDYSRYCFVYFIKSKTEVLEKLMQFVAEVQADGHTIRRLRSDGGLEFCNEDVRKFLLQYSIKHEVTTPRAPEQNGFIERQNRTVVESAKAMLHDRELPLFLWAEATNTAVYLKNRTATNVLSGSTPYEKWFGKKPTVKHLRVFGCDAYVHIAKDQRTKWDKNASKCVMLGYNDASKAYRVYDPQSRKIFIRRDVKFDENLKSYNECTATIRQAADDDNLDAHREKEAEEKSAAKSSKRQTENNREPYQTRSAAKQTLNSDEPVNAEVCMAQFEPTTLEEALKDVDAGKWAAAIEDELKALQKNETWDLVERSNSMHVMTNRWIFKRKYNSSNEIEKYKARLVVRGCSQIRGIDYTEVYSPVVRYESVRTVMAVAAAKNMKIVQFDVKTAFLHGYIAEDIYMEQPYGYKKDDRVCKLKKSLYGLKQASRQWNRRIVEFLLFFGFRQASADTCVFIYNTGSETMYLLLYVDDGLICGNNNNHIKELLDKLHTEFEITYKDAEYFVGMQMKLDTKQQKLIIHQNIYALNILERFNHSDCFAVSTPAEVGKHFSKADDNNPKPKFPYREAIGSLMYLMVCTRPDIAYIVGVLSRYLENPSEMHWQGVKRVLKYIKGTTQYGISFSLNSGQTNITMFCDADWGNDVDTRRSISGYIAFINSGPVSWSSRRQTVTATSTTEAEFVAICASTKSVVWLRKLILEVDFKQINATPLNCDNQKAVELVKNPEASKRTKHVDIQYFYSCDMQANGEINIQYVESGKQLADLLTKPLSKDKFEKLIKQYGLASGFVVKESEREC